MIEYIYYLSFVGQPSRSSDLSNFSEIYDLNDEFAEFI